MRRLIAVFIISFSLTGAACQGEVRQPAVAGEFYPSDPSALASAVEGYISHAEKLPPEGELIALVAPHAGYDYSGGVAGWSFRQVSGASYDTVIVIGPTHRFGFQGASVYTGDYFATPLGEIPIDKAMAMSFLDAKSDIVNEPRAHEKEHSLEVEMPFLQKALKGFKVVPIVVGDPTHESMESLSSSLARVMRDKAKKTLIVVSTDWSHYHDYDTAVRMDGRGMQTVAKLSSFELYGRVSRGETELCGIFPMMLALDVANKLGADTVKLYKYANSGDVTGDKRSVVGYAAMGIYRLGKSSGQTLSEPQKDSLINVARETVEGYVRTKKAPEPKVQDPALSVPRGAFVTLKEDGRLRGCIGDFFSSEPLYMTVRDMAVEACSHDGRFQPVTGDELGRIKYEISVLSPLKRISGIDDIKVGRDGLYIIKGSRAGVLLPQVPVEQGWDRDTFLAQTCGKAGLPPDAWKQGADIYVFTAEVFGEK
jgi:AmmeMemoRadiSam system protein B/AmmeMemoRadiSam system protein A